MATRGLIIGDVPERDVLLNIFSNYMSTRDRDEFLDHVIGMFDLEEYEDEILDDYTTLEYYISAKAVLEELEQYLSTDDVDDLNEWLQDEYGLAEEW